MIGGAADPDQQRANEFSRYSDAELMAEIAKLANELQVTSLMSVKVCGSRRTGPSKSTPINR